MGLNDGDDSVVNSPFPFDYSNLRKNHWYGAVAPTNPQNGMIWVKNDGTSQLYHNGSWYPLLNANGIVPLTGTMQEDKGANIASADPLVPGADGNFFHVTGTTNFTAINAAQSQPGTVICLVFDGILTMTHHAADLILPGKVNITTIAGDRAIFIEESADKWRCIAYVRANHSIWFTEQVLTSGAAIAWNLADGNKAILTAAHNFTVTITSPIGALNAQLIITQDGTGTRVMDEIITQSDTTIAPGDVSAGDDEITIAIDIPTGARIRFKTTAADLPDPLVVDTIYYAIRVDATTIKVATTKANAHAGTQIDITDQGTGTHTVQQLVKWMSGTLGVLTVDVGAEDIVSLTYKTADKQWYAVLNEDWS